MKTLDQIIGEHRSSPPRSTQLALIAGCGQQARFKPGEFLFVGDDGRHFFLLRRGTVALELEIRGAPVSLRYRRPGRRARLVLVVPPHEWQFDGRALDEVGVVRFDGTCLRGKCDADPVLGYALMKAFAAVLVDRFIDTRLQLVDVYGERP